MAEIPNPFDAPKVQTSMQENVRKAAQVFKDKPFGTPFYLKVVGGEIDEPTNRDTVMKMSHYANPSLAQHTTYFSALDKMMQCVEKNADVTCPAA